MNAHNPNIFRTNIHFPIELQREIIQLARAAGFSSARRPYWLAKSLRNLQPIGLPAEAEAHFKSKNFEMMRKIELALRTHPQFDWEWERSPLAAKVEAAIKRALRFYKKLTRVVVLLQVPGNAIPAHRDLVVGEPTGEGIFIGDEEVFQILGPLCEEIPHSERRLSLKVPLSEREGDAGRPFFCDGGTKQFYSSEEHAFFINECELLHGAEAVDYYRGVIFIDGILNKDELALENALPMKIIATEEKPLDAQGSEIR